MRGKLSPRRDLCLVEGGTLRHAWCFPTGLTGLRGVMARVAIAEGVGEVPPVHLGE